MSWYTDFKTGTKDHIAKGSGKKSKGKSYSYGASSWWMDDWDYSPAVYSSYSKKEIWHCTKVHILNFLTSIC